MTHPPSPDPKESARKPDETSISSHRNLDKNPSDLAVSGSTPPKRQAAGSVSSTWGKAILVGAFEGWNDAGNAATGAVEHLELMWDAQPLAEIDSDDYIDYQVNRPNIRQLDGVTREITWPTTTLSMCSPGGDLDVVLLRGIEPNMRWRAFCTEVLRILDDIEIDSVVMLGSLLADTAHTRPVPVTGAAYSDISARRYNLEQNRYEGPTGITAVLQDQCVRNGIPAISFWAAVPHYISTPPNPKASLALLTRLEEVLDCAIPLGQLPTQAEEWEAAINDMTDDDEEIADYVRTLEERGDSADDLDEAIRKIDGDALAADIERYLRRRGPGSGP